jgi:tetratricopeptide (TPR) repeat protein
MMKFHAGITTALASLLVLPAVSGQERARTLEQALSQTVRSLEMLTGIETEVASGTPDGMRRLRAITESAGAERREQDSLLVELRDDVGRLQVELEMLQGTMPYAATGASSPSSTGMPPGAGDLTTGLTDAQRQAIMSTLQVPSQPTPTGSGAGLTPTSPAGPTTYTADPLGQGRACYRAGQFERGLALLEPLRTDPSAVYLKARCLEQLGRHDEALAAFKRVIELAPEGFEAGRAKSDIEFLEWKASFLSSLKKEAAAAGGSSK